MQVGIHYGRESLELRVAQECLIRHDGPAAPPLSDPVSAVRDSLETPHAYPALRRALTPDDHVCVVVDESLPRMAELLTPLLDHIASAGVAAEAITLLCPPSPRPSRQEWVDELPDAFEEVRLEVHDPGNRQHLSYLATTKKGRRVYLNRTAVDADQLVLLTARRFDPLLGVSGCEGALYPELSNEATRLEVLDQLSMAGLAKAVSSIRVEAVEIAWLVGAPFLVQFIEGGGDTIANVVCGTVEASSEGQRLLEARWRTTVAHRAETVIASVSGSPDRCGFAEMARALACAARVVKPDGRIVLLTQAEPRLDKGAELLRGAEDPRRALDLLKEHKPPDMAAAFQWASAAQQARIYLLSGLPPETAEELFVVPMDQAGQVQRLLDGQGTALFLEDAHKRLVEVEKHGRLHAAS